MSVARTRREIERVYIRLGELLDSGDPLFDAAREASVERLYAAAARTLGITPEAVETRTLEHSAAPVFADVLLDEMLPWRAPDGARLLDRLQHDKRLRKRPLARQYLALLDTSTVRLWHVEKAGTGAFIEARRVDRDAPAQRIERVDDVKHIDDDDVLVARRMRLGGVRVFVDSWLAFPPPCLPALRELEGDALLERAFTLWTLLALGEQDALDGWLRTLDSGMSGEDGAHRDGDRADNDRHRGDDATGKRHRPAPRHGPSDPERERLLDRIRKLFAMAQETDASPHEAEIALRRCQSLMARFGISEADLETSQFGVASVASGRSVTAHAKILGGAVALLHDVIFVIGPKGMAEYRGYDIDVRVATLTHEYLRDAMERALSTRKRRGELPPGRSAAFDYRVAFADEVYGRVVELAAERAAQERDAAGDGTALAVRKREQVDQAFGDGLVSKRLEIRGPRDAEAAGAGRADGGEVSLDPQLG